MPRLHVERALAAADDVPLPPAAARHVQVLRLQPGDALVLFDGRGGEWSARVRRMGRADVHVDVLEHLPADRELPVAVTLAVGMPANERMDGLVEKAAELGAASIQPLLCERSVLRLSGERAERRQAHWQAVAVAASEQCGRTRVADVAPVRALDDWLAAIAPAAARWMLTPGAERPLSAAFAQHGPPVADDPHPLSGARRSEHGPGAFRAPAGDARCPVVILSGPEGGLTEAESRRAAAAGFVPVSLGPRVLRADTAPLAALAWIALRTP